MGTIKLYPFSLVVGAAVALLAFVTMGQQSVPPGSIHAMPYPQCQEFLVEYGPHPRDYVQVKEGEPYTVPAGRLFVLSGLGSTGTQGGGNLVVDGQTEVHATGSTWSSGGGYGNSASVKLLPRGFTAAGGSVVEVTGTNSRAWGYLVDA